jgi:UDP-N-acetylmuramate--alanine ligase
MLNYRTPVAVSGTHGKTTTTSMISQILLDADLDPTLSVGGMLPSIGGNLRIGHSEYFVAEACEYTNSFLDFFPRISLILNVEADHLDFFKDLEDIRHSFHRFAQLLPENGTLVIGASIENYRELTEGVKGQILTFGPEPVDAYGSPVDFYPEDITYDKAGCASFTAVNGSDRMQVKLSVPGSHNVLNALAAIACCRALGLNDDQILPGLAAFGGTDRRFQHKGTFDGITVVDDYAHHPTEIEATLAAASRVDHKRLFVVFQPHTYTRTKALLPEFAEALSHADRVVLADIYAAREKNTVGISSADLRDAIRAKGKECEYFPSFEEIEDYLRKNCQEGDLLITMGAGDVYKIGEALLS